MMEKWKLSIWMVIHAVHRLIEIATNDDGADLEIEDDVAHAQDQDLSKFF